MESTKTDDTAQAVVPEAVVPEAVVPEEKTLQVNGTAMKVTADATTPLLWILREQLGLTGTKYGCGIAQCGSCTVHLNGTPVRSCVMPLAAVSETTAITTIEGLSETADHPVQQAWAELDVPQCGYCQPGMIMAAAGLLNSNATPTDADIDAQITNICRCGTFQRVRKGIHLASAKTQAAQAAKPGKDA